MALRLFQSWALAFKSKSELSFFVDVYNELKNSGPSRSLSQTAKLTSRYRLPPTALGNITTSARYDNGTSLG